MCDSMRTVAGYTMRSGDVVREFDLPAEATRDGRVTLSWQCDTGERGVHVAELFFLKNQQK